MSLSSPLVTLEMMLKAREQRAFRQSQWQKKNVVTLLSLTLVTPGPVKDNAVYRRCMQVAMDACVTSLEEAAFLIQAQQIFWLETGPEALIALDADPLELKKQTCLLEDNHPLGRLWDIDIIRPEGQGVSRRDLKQPPRRCLLCDEPAHACSRSRKHEMSQILEKSQRILLSYFKDENLS